MIAVVEKSYTRMMLPSVEIVMRLSAISARRFKMEDDRQCPHCGEWINIEFEIEQYDFKVTKHND